MTAFKIGDRVRMVQTDSKGTVVGDLRKSPITGGPRLPVKWDNTGMVHDWGPGLLRTADSNPADDPDEVIVEDGEGCIAGRRRGKVTIDQHGVTIIVPEGFFRR